MTQDDQMWTSYFGRHLLGKTISKTEWKLVSCHPYLPVSLVQSHPHLPWDWNAMSRNSFEKIKTLLILFPSKEWDWHYLSSSLPVGFIQNHPFLNWKQDKLNRRKYSFERLYTSLHFALINHQMPWNWTELSRHPYVTMDHVFRYPFLQWDIEYILSHRSFHDYHLPYIRHSNRNYHLLSKNPYNTLSIVRTHIKKPWDWSELAQNCAFRPQSVYRHRHELPLWRWDLSLRNPQLTWDFYHFIRKEKTIHHQFQHLVKNHFKHANPLFLYCRIVIQRFLCGILRRRFIYRKLRLLKELKRRIHDKVLLQRILFSYV